MSLKIGDKAPDFSAPDETGKLHTLKDYKGRVLALYFYPKDSTSGCTAQACDFRDALAAFNAIGVAVLGVSRDSAKSHAKFKEKEGLNFPLLVDDGKLSEAYATWVEKSMYGRKYMGMERSTFLIGPDGRIAEIWRKVKVPGHVEAVRQSAAKLRTKAA